MLKKDTNMNFFRTLYLLLAFAVITIDVHSQSLGNFFDAADVFMKKWVKNGDIDYMALKSEQKELETLKEMIAKADLNSASEDEKKAFYINAYNLLVIHQVTSNYPLKSAMDKSGFFDAIRHNVAGTPATLDRLEKKYLILAYGDPRIHFAVACAAKSCPKLASFSYRPSKLNEQLDERTNEAINSRYVVNLSKSDKKVWVSKIFDWYKRDFGGNEDGIEEFINKYRKATLPSWSLGYLEYDWTLNDIEVGK